MLKRILKSDGFRRLVCWLGSLYIRFAHATTRWTSINAEIPQKFWNTDKPFILAFWHGRMLMMTPEWPRKRPVHMLISQHRDGQLIANTIAHFGIQTIAGSTSKGGAGALRAMVKALKSGDSIGFTPDGPRGPRMRVSDGLVATAKLAGVPIIPASCATSRRKALSSWDRFLIIWPFGKGVYIWGEPIIVTKTDDPETVRHHIEDTLNTLSADADRMVGQTPIEPAPVPSAEVSS